MCDMTHVCPKTWVMSHVCPKTWVMSHVIMCWRKVCFRCHACILHMSSYGVLYVFCILLYIWHVLGISCIFYVICVQYIMCSMHIVYIVYIMYTIYLIYFTLHFTLRITRTFHVILLVYVVSHWYKIITKNPPARAWPLPTASPALQPQHPAQD